jgi:hypothetical protein
MSSFVTARTWFRVSLGAHRSATNLPLRLSRSSQRLLRLLINMIVTIGGYGVEREREIEERWLEKRSG